MKFKMPLNYAALYLVASLCPFATFAQSTAFTYQGRLNDGANAASGTYDLRFAIYDSASGGAQQGNAVTNNTTAISNGLFTVTLDFGNQFPGADRWLEIGVRTNGADVFATLSPRQQITATPYAVQAGNATSAGSVAAGNISGVIELAQLPPAVVTNGASGVNFYGTFTGTGAGITNVTIANLRETIPVAAAWGLNFFGQTDVPPGLSNVVAMAGGYGHSLALKSDGTVVGWGKNSSGEVNVPAGLSNVVAIAAGTFHSLALKNDGTVVAWGDAPGVPVNLSNVVAISAGGIHDLALLNNGTVIAWGIDTDGQTIVPGGLSNVVAIAAGFFHSVALKGDGTVMAWGKNDYGQTSVPGGLSGVMAVSTLYDHVLALKTNGTVVAWGDNSFGQTSVPSGLSGVVAVAAGGRHSLALKIDGTVVGWGSNGSGEISIPGGLYAFGIAGGLLHSMAIQKSFQPAQVALLNQNNVFTHTNTFTGQLTVNGALYGSAPYLKYAEVTTGTTQGGTANAGTNNWRKFNVEIADPYNLGATNGTGDIILPAGTYQCRISAPAFEVSTHQIRLRTSGGTTLIYGTTAYSSSVNDRSLVEGQFTLASPTTLRVQHWCFAGNSGNGLGALDNDADIWGDAPNFNVFATAEFWKIK